MSYNNVFDEVETKYDPSKVKREEREQSVEVEVVHERRLDDGRTPSEDDNFETFFSFLAEQICTLPAKQFLKAKRELIVRSEEVYSELLTKEKEQQEKRKQRREERRSMGNTPLRPNTTTSRIIKSSSHSPEKPGSSTSNNHENSSPSATTQMQQPLLSDRERQEYLDRLLMPPPALPNSRPKPKISKQMSEHNSNLLFANSSAFATCPPPVDDPRFRSPEAFDAWMKAPLTAEDIARAELLAPEALTPDVLALKSSLPSVADLQKAGLLTNSLSNASQPSTSTATTAAVDEPMTTLPLDKIKREVEF